MKKFVLVLGLVLMSVPARGSFGVSVDVPDAFERAGAVFIGEVVKIDKLVTSEIDAPLDRQLYKITFKVEYSWKGAGFRELVFPEFVVLSDQGEPEYCYSRGTYFMEGRKYLVYAHETSDKKFMVYRFSRTVPLSMASADIEELRKLDTRFILRSKPRPE